MSDAQGARRPARRGIYLLPNLLTTTALFFGFFAIISGINGEYATAALAVFVAMVMDTLDGRVARATRTQTDFGVEYDSISDMISFGLAPSLVVYEWALRDLSALGPLAEKFGWLAAFVYAACAGLRLARFNTQAAAADKRFFQGLPSPAAAATLAGFVWAGDRLGFSGATIGVLALLLTLVAGLLMVSNIRFYSFKEVDFRFRVPFVAIVLIVVVIALTSVYPPLVLFLIALPYLVSGPILTVVRRRQRRRRRRGHRKQPPAG